MDVHPTKNVSIGIDPYPNQLVIFRISIDGTSSSSPRPRPSRRCWPKCRRWRWRPAPGVKSESENREKWWKKSWEIYEKIGRNIWVSGWSRNWWHKHGKFMAILSHVNVKSPSSVEMLPLPPLGFHHWKHPVVFLSSNSGSQTSSGILSGKKKKT